MFSKFYQSMCLVLSFVMLFLGASSVGYALTFDFMGADAKKWFDEFVKHKTVAQGGGDAGWQLTKEGLTTDNNVATGHQRIGIFEEKWTDYTIESKYKYLKFGAHKEAHLYIRWEDADTNYFFRTIGRKNNAGAGSGYSIEWLRKIGGKDNEGDITDDKKIVGELKEKGLIGLRGKIEGQLLTVDFFKNNEWKKAGEVKYQGPHKKGGIGVGRATAEVAWQYLRINGKGIPKDNLPVEALNKVATTWGKLKRP